MLTIIPKSIRWKIQAWHGLLLVGLVTALTVGFYYLESRTRFREIDTQLHAFAPSILSRALPRPGPQRPGEDFRGFTQNPQRRGPQRESLGRPESGRPPPPREGPPAIDERVLDRLEHAGIYFIIWSPNGEILTQLESAPKPAPLPPTRGEFKPENQLRSRGDFRELIHQAPGRQTVLIGKSVAKTKEELRKLALELSGVGILVVLLGLAGGWWLTGRAIRPISEISEAAKKISGGDLSHRIHVIESNSELGQLAGVLNQTFERLEKSFEQQVRFTADASHELRTPISVILTQIQLALSRERSVEDYRQTLETCERAAERMRVLVNALLELARVDSGDFELIREACDLGCIAQDALEFVEPLALQKKIEIKKSIEAIKTKGDALKLSQVFINLLSNAIQHNKDSTEIYFSVNRENNQAVIRIADNGIGIAESALPRLFDRFFRADQSRSRAQGNNGLGLAICKVIVEAHGGSISAKSEKGSGTEFIFKLPISLPIGD